MTNNPQIYHGEWWVPAVADPDTCMIAFNPEQMMGHETKYTGTLTYYEDKDCTLELYHVPSNFHSRHYCQNEVIWGRDANGHIFTLFNVMMIEKRLPDFTNTKFTVGLILIGEHVLSMNEMWSKKCRVHFPYLNNWLFYETKKYITPLLNYNEYHLNASIGGLKLLEVEIEKGVFWRLFHNIKVAESIEGITINKTPFLDINSSKPSSLYSYLRQIAEFEQFFSIALYGEQSHSSIQFLDRTGNRDCTLLMKKDTSYNPDIRSVIKFSQLKEKLPEMLITWHENYEKVSPISSYLIRSLQKKNSFDVPDFLIIAQALDGYHKRFVNSKSLINHKKYEDGIKILLKQFKDIDCIQKCKINPQVLTQTRDKYSHLLTDEDKPLAVEGEDLYWLTEKCKILLTCCILNMLGLTNKEINLCCENSPISQIIDSLPFEPETE